MGTMGTGGGGGLHSSGVFVPNTDSLLVLRSREADPNVRDGLDGREEREGAGGSVLVLRDGYTRSVRRWFVKILAIIFFFLLAAVAIGG